LNVRFFSRNRCQVRKNLWDGERGGRKNGAEGDMRGKKKEEVPTELNKKGGERGSHYVIFGILFWHSTRGKGKEGDERRDAKGRRNRS